MDDQHNLYAPTTSHDEAIAEFLSRFISRTEADTLVARLHEHRDLYTAAVQNIVEHGDVSVGPRDPNGRAGWSFRFLTMDPPAILRNLLDGKPIT